MKTFREQLKRRCLLREKEEKAEEKVRYDFRDRSELIGALRAKNEKLEFYKKKSTLLQFEVKSHKSSSKLLRKEIREITAKGTFGDVAATISRSVRKGMLKDKTGVINIITTIAKNLPKKSKGHRYQSEENSDYADLFESAMIMGGAKICDLLADNLGGPNSETIKLWTKKNSFEYDFSNFKKTVEFIVSLYKSCKIRIQESRKVPYLKAEDETAIEARLTYDEKLDCVWGYCRPLDHRECEEDFVIFVGNEEDAYERLVEAMNTSKLANYARVIMINPIHERLPRIVLHLQANCNCFTHNTVIHQWLKYDAICKEILDPILGPDIGKSSNGDGRRRKLMLNQSSDVNEEQCYKPVPIDEGFLFSANITQNSEREFDINNLSDQDYIHNHKKLDNQLDYVSKDLKLGNYPVHRNFL